MGRGGESSFPPRVGDVEVTVEHQTHTVSGSFEHTYSVVPLCGNGLQFCSETELPIFVVKILCNRSLPSGRTMKAGELQSPPNQLISIHEPHNFLLDMVHSLFPFHFGI